MLAKAKEPGPWVEQISKRRPQNVVTITLANKMARAIWALLAYDRSYVRGYPSEHAIDMLFAPAVSRIGVIEPGMIGITRPPEVVPKRDFEGFQECCFLPDLAMAFSLL